MFTELCKPVGPPTTKWRQSQEESWNLPMEHLSNMVRKEQQKGSKELFVAQYKRRLEVVVEFLSEKDSLSERITFASRMNKISALRHPNLLPVLGGWCMNSLHTRRFDGCSGAVAGHGAYVVTEYIEDEQRLSTLPVKSLSTREILSILRDIAAGLTYIHFKGIVHGNLRDTNTVISRDPLRAKIKAAGFFKTDAVDYRFAAPEVRRGSNPTSASDIYSFGILFKKLLPSGLTLNACETLTTADISETFSMVSKELEKCCLEAPEDRADAPTLSLYLDMLLEQ